MMKRRIPIIKELKIKRTKISKKPKISLINPNDDIDELTDKLHSCMIKNCICNKCNKCLIRLRKLEIRS